VNATYQESPVTITVRDGPSPIVEIVLKDGDASVFKTKLSFPNMERAEEYAHYMAQRMGVTSYSSISGSQTCTRSVALLIELTSEDFDHILKHANESSPVYSRLKNSLKIATDTFVIPCDISEAEMLLDVAKHFSPEAVPKINDAIRAFRGA
jgi:hypothetical protein